jgi:hypothetical protein
MLIRSSLVLLAAASAPFIAQTGSRDLISDRVMKLTREDSWKPVSSLPVDFPTHHPQGLVKIGETFYHHEVSAACRRIRSRHRAGNWSSLQDRRERQTDRGPYARRGLDLSPRRD